MNYTQNIWIYVVVVSVGVLFIAGCSSPGNIPADASSNNNVVEQAPNAASNVADNGANASDTQGATARRQFNSSRPPGRYGGMNLTDEQRAQMMQQRIQLETDACSGKSENDACTVAMPSQYGPGGTRSGTCTMQNSTLLCRTSFGGERDQSGTMPSQAVN